MPTAPTWCEMLEQDRNANVRWFRRCGANSVPFIAVLMRRKYATLRWDCITVDAEHDSALRGDESGEIRRLLLSLFQSREKTGRGRPIFEGSAFVGTIEGLHPREARNLADQFF